MNNHRLISKYKNAARKKFLTVGLSHDLSVVINSLCSVLNVFHFITNFGKVAGMKINWEKTKGFFFNRTGMHNIEHLPEILWNDKTEILGIPYDNDNCSRLVKWNENVSRILEDVCFYNSLHLTPDAESIISKSKFLPMIFLYGSNSAHS